MQEISKTAGEKSSQGARVNHQDAHRPCCGKMLLEFVETLRFLPLIVLFFALFILLFELFSGFL